MARITATNNINGGGHFQNGGNRLTLQLIKVMRWWQPSPLFEKQMPKPLQCEETEVVVGIVVVDVMLRNSFCTTISRVDHNCSQYCRVWQPQMPQTTEKHQQGARLQQQHQSYQKHVCQSSEFPKISSRKECTASHSQHPKVQYVLAANLKDARTGNCCKSLVGNRYSAVQQHLEER